MGTIIAFFTGLYGKVIALGIKLMALVATGLAKVGIKLLSYEWIKKIYEVIGKVLSFIKKVFLNQKVIAILKYVLAIGLCGITLVQIYFVGNSAYAGFGDILALLKTDSIGVKIFSSLFLAVLVIGVLATTILCLRSVLKIFKKQIKLGFVPALLFTYLALIFLSSSLKSKAIISVMESFKLINVLAIVLAVFAFFKLFDKAYPVSFFGLVFASIGIVLAFLIFKALSFGSLINFEIVGEIAFSGKDVYLTDAINGFLSPQDSAGLMRMVALWGLSFAKDSGNFATSIVLTLSTFAIMVCQILPYALLSCAIGLLMGLVNERQQQYAYLTKVLKTLGYMLITVAIAFVLILILVLAFKTPKGVYLIVTQNVGGFILTFGIILALVILTAGARALFAHKLYGKRMPKKIK